MLNGLVKKIKWGDQWKGLWLTPLSILFFPLCTSESPLCSFTLGDSRVGRSKPVWAKQNSQDLWKSWFLDLKKKKNLRKPVFLCLDMNMESCRIDYHQLLSYNQWGILVLKLPWYWSYKEFLLWIVEHRSQKNQSPQWLCWVKGLELFRGDLNLNF